MNIVKNCTECQLSLCAVLSRYCTILKEKDDKGEWVNTDCPPKGIRWNCPLQSENKSKYENI